MTLLQFPEHATIEQINRGRELMHSGYWRKLYEKVLAQYEKPAAKQNQRPNAS